MQKEKCFTGCLKENKKFVNKINVILNLFQDLIHFLKRNKAEMLKRVQHDVFFNYSAFTLIELLVVVLIIGILAAVALPQYQKAVEKSRAAQALTMLKTVYTAAEQYYLANGTHATSFDELSVDIPWTGTRVWYGNDAGRSRSNQDWSVELYRASNGSYPGVITGRLSGKYAGAAFGMYLQPSPYGTGVVCLERVNDNGVKFKETAGAYCQKLFKGTLIETDSVRTYKLP